MIVLHTLGVAAIHLGARRLLPTASRAFASLLYLGIERGREVPRGELQGLLFPEQSERTAAHNLRQLLYRLRGLGAPVVADDRCVCVPGAEVRDDFSSLGATGFGTNELEAVAGGILPGYAPDFSRPFSAWVEWQRGRIGHGVLDALAVRLTELRSAGRWRELEPVARAVVGLDPLNEEATLALAECLALRGQKARAMQLLDAYLEDVGPYGQDLRLPAHILRTRISEHVPEPRYRRMGPGPFVGRDAEMAELWRHYQSAKRGEARTVVIYGEPGIGKTRLATEFLRAAALDGATCLKVECAPHDVRRPLGVFVDLVPKLLEAPGGLGVSPEGMELLRRLTAAKPDRTDPLAIIEPQSLSHAIEDAIVDSLEAVAGEQPLVIVLDDGQFADMASLRLLLETRARARPLSVLAVICASNRLPSSKSLCASAGLLQLHVRGLAPDSSLTLVQRLVSDHQLHVDDSVASAMSTLSVGNPLYIESLVQDFRGDPNRGLQTSTLESLLQRRIDDLDDIALVVLAACAVIGRSCYMSLVEKVAGVPPFDLVRALHDLRDQGLLRDSGTDADIVHPILIQVTLRRIGDPARRVMHRRTAKCLEDATNYDNSPSHMLDCARHWKEAGESGRGTELLRAYSKYCIQIGQPATAYEVLADAGRVAVPEALEPLLCDTIRAAELAEQYEGACRHYSALRKLRGSSTTHDDLELTEINASRHTGVSLADRAGQLRQCLSSAEASPRHRLRAAAIYIIYADGWFEQAEAERAIQCVRPLATIDDECATLWLNVELLYQLHFGDPAIAVECANRAMALLHRGENEWHVGALGMNASVAYFVGGEFDRAVATLLSVREKARTKGMRRVAAQAASLLCTIHLDYGSLNEARRWHAAATTAIAAIDSHSGMYSYLSNGIELALLNRDASEARRWLAFSRDTYVELKSPHNAAIEAGYDALIAQLEGLRGNGVTAVIDRLWGHHLRARFSWSHDALVQALVSLLITAGRSHDAHPLLARYLKAERREKTPLRTGLASLARELGISHRYPSQLQEGSAADNPKI